MPPTGFMTSAATRSLETAARGCTLNRSTRIGVMRAPPPMPVRPTVKPTMRPASATVRLTCMSGEAPFEYLYRTSGDGRESPRHLSRAKRRTSEASLGGESDALSGLPGVGVRGQGLHPSREGPRRQVGHGDLL